MLKESWIVSVINVPLEVLQCLFRDLEVDLPSIEVPRILRRYVDEF